PDPEVVGGGERPISEGSNTHWRPTEPWLDSPRRRGAEPANGRKPSDGRGNLDPAPDPDEASTPPEQQSGSSSSDPSSGSNATPDPS
ncbi:MAG TPA: hypothetical protein VFS67_35785, partial [Polyangiaceae bacterium]|nr:hypothetical protein [Polyangiaceae bacterium]